MYENKLIKKIIICLIIIVIIFLSGYFLNKKNHNKINISVLPSVQILGHQNDLVSFSVDPGQKVSGILTVAGAVRGGYFFEGNILLNILDANKKVIRKGNGNAKTNWTTTDPVGFDGVLDFTKISNGQAYIEIHNDNASGLPENDKSILIPIIINN